MNGFYKCSLRAGTCIRHHSGCDVTKCTIGVYSTLNTNSYKRTVHQYNIALHQNTVHFFNKVYSPFRAKNNRCSKETTFYFNHTAKYLQNQLVTFNITFDHLIHTKKTLKTNLF